MRFEELIALDQELGSNVALYNTYKAIKGKISKGILVIFFGTGCSLYVKKWKTPFDDVLSNIIKRIEKYKKEKQIPKKKELEASIKKSTDSIHSSDQKTADELKKLNGDISLLNKQKRKCRKIQKALSSDNPDFLRIGDEIEAIILELNNLPSWKVIYSINNYHSFNSACCQELQNYKSNEIAKLSVKYYSNPYKIEPIFFFHFLSKEFGIRLVTTNVDSCYDDICQEFGIEKGDIVPYSILPSNQNREYEKWAECNKSIYYIHGHINKPESLVMKKTDYESIYPSTAKAKEGITSGTMAILKEIAENYCVLFLGASLVEDLTVTILKNYHPFDHNNPEYNPQYFPFYCRSNLPKESGFPSQRFKSIIVPSFNDYQTIIHMLLRETAAQTKTDAPIYKDSNWRQEGFSVECKNWDDLQPPSDGLVKAITDFFASPYGYDVLPLKNNEHEIDKPQMRWILLKHLVTKYAWSSVTDKRSGWSICRITGNDFTLYDVNDNVPYNNLPLGNTIYLVGWDEYMDSKKADDIVKKINRWREYSYPNECESFLGDDLKVRVIHLFCQSEEERYKVELEAKNAEIERLKTEKKELEDRIKSAKNLEDLSDLRRLLMQNVFLDARKGTEQSQVLDRGKTRILSREGVDSN